MATATHCHGEGKARIACGFPVRICRAGRDGIAVSVDQELFGIPGERGWYVGNEYKPGVPG